MAVKQNRIRDSRTDRAFDTCNFLLATIFLLLVAYPCIYVLSASFSSPKALISGQVWLWPVHPGLQGYQAVFADRNVWIGFANSLFYTVAGTAINVTMTIAAAYPLSRRDLYGRNVLMMLFTFTMIFSGGMIPTYILVRNLHMLNTRWALLIPGALSVYNVIIARTFFITNIPNEMLEAARIDGCNDFTFIMRIVIPLSGAIIAVIALFSMAGHWNSFFDALLYLSDKRKYPLQLFLRDILLMNSTSDLSSNLEEQEQRLYLSELLKYSLIVVASAPLLMIYPFIQKYLVKGVMIGSIKG